MEGREVEKKGGRKIEQGKIRKENNISYLSGFSDSVLVWLQFISNIEDSLIIAKKKKKFRFHHPLLTTLQRLIISLRVKVKVLQ